MSETADALLDDVADILARLVGFDTTSQRSNLQLIDWVEQRLESVGAVCRRVPDDTGNKAGLVARLGPRQPRGVVLSAHSDCVPVEADDWDTDPFVLAREGDRLIGRGTADMKGFLATVLAVAARTDLDALQRPVTLALSRDEELGALGGPDLVAALQEWGTDPEAVLVGEPTSMRPVVAHKGVRTFTTTVTGVAGHSSQPRQAANAVTACARIAVFLDELADTHRRTGGDEDFDPPYTTFNAGVIQGGSAVNIVPERCELTWEYRPVPADDSFLLRDQVQTFVEREVLPRLNELAAGGEAHTESTAVVPSLAREQDSPAAELVTGLQGVEPEAGTVAFGTDGGHFQAAGWSTVVCGPGSIDHAHRPDEHVTVDQLERSVAMVEDLFARAAGPG